MSAKITELVDRIAKLEHQLIEEIKEQETKFHYKLEGSKVRFEESVEEAHRKLKIAILPWLLSSMFRNVISAPFIYGMILPLMLMDLTMTFYQHVCFRLYNVGRVTRSNYIVIDRHQLSYLNGIEKFNCLYCSYGNGVIAYTREVIARTEQYWCPIKHARKVVGTHRYYNKFLGFGDSENYQEQVLRFRDELKPEKAE